MKSIFDQYKSINLSSIYSVGNMRLDRTQICSAHTHTHTYAHPPDQTHTRKRCSDVECCKNILSSPHYMWIIFNVHINVTITRLYVANSKAYSMLYRFSQHRTYIWIQSLKRSLAQTHGKKEAIHKENDVKKWMRKIPCETQNHI